MKKTASLLIVLFFACRIFSQDTLPQFTLNDRGDRVIISWVNPYTSLVQLNVQRSYDSLKFFTTVYSATSPQLPQNGYTEKKLPTNRVFYRIFYVLQGGTYFFSHSKRAGGSPTGNAMSDKPATRDIKNADVYVSPEELYEKRIVTIKIKDTVLRQLPGYAFQSFRDSILKQTKDTLFAINDTLVSLSPYVVKEVWKASVYVFVSKDGYINISLPQAAEKKYTIKFYEEKGTPLFEIPVVRESPLILEKANFIHSGWFLFELYEDNKLKEKNKFYLSKDF